MEKDIKHTDVIFRVDKSKDWKGTVFAIFPHIVETLKGDVLTYQHQGQHSAGDYNHMIKTSRPAKESEYHELKNELEGNYGYLFNVIKKANRNKYLKSYYDIRK